MSPGLISLLIFAPLVSILLILFLPERFKNWYKYISLATALVILFLSIVLTLNFSNSGKKLAGINNISEFQYVEKVDWIGLKLGNLGKISIDYFIGIDGLSISMVLLSGLVLVLAVLASWNEEKSLKGYHILFLILCSSIIGCFVALDFFLFYLFFELLLLPMYFLIGMWGGPRREYASIKFFLYTLAGSLLILLVMIALCFSVIDPAETAVNMGLAKETSLATPEVVAKVQQLLKQSAIGQDKLVHTFNMIYMMDQANYIPDSILHSLSGMTLCGHSMRLIAFLALIIGFIIKLPSVPFHTWLPDAHVEAPTAISVILAAILLKVGAYGILRVPYSMFPEGGVYFASLIGWVGVVSIIYGAFNALAMRDIKKMIAYSSVSHMGFVLLGIASMTPEGVNGSVFQMFSHGILSALLFLLAGVIYDRTHDRNIDSYRGLASRMPYYTILVTIAFFASLGLPGFSGFIGELFVLLGAFNSSKFNGLLSKWQAAIAAIGILLGAVYYLWTLQKMFFGKFWTRKPHYWAKMTDLTHREFLVLLPLVALTIILGLYPGLLFDLISPAVAKLVDVVLVNGKQNLSQIKLQ